MTKVAVTGHMNGLGKAFTQLLPNTIGFDKLNGYSITTDYKSIAESAQDCNVFINNAYDGRGQIFMHNAIEQQYKNTSKLIINISSLTLDLYPERNDEYAQVKRELERISKYARCRCKCVRVPLMDTQLTRNKPLYKTDPNIIAKAIIQWHIS
tara:strand:+ start:3799 stop:4257 length:459 start_codon:yes stop_codon:yes gene_type:complete